MDETPEDGSARAFDSPSIWSKLDWRPGATIRESYERVRPELVVMELELGSKDWTFSEIWLRWDGMRLETGLRSSVFVFKPEPTSVLWISQCEAPL